LLDGHITQKCLEFNTQADGMLPDYAKHRIQSVTTPPHLMGLTERGIPLERNSLGITIEPPGHGQRSGR
jgi:hypothetical protein